MKIKKMHINNYKGIENVDITFNYGVNFIISENNVGKTRVLECLNDFFDTKAEWNCELYVEFTLEELNSLGSDFTKCNTKIIKKQKRYYANKSDITKLVKDGAIGQCIYIPAVANHDDQINVSKTSSAINSLIKGLSNEDITKSLAEINNNLTNYVEKLKKAIKGNVENINKSLVFKEIDIDLDISDVNPDELIKNNIQLKASENGGILDDISKLGSGIQRNIVNSILLNGINPEKFTLVLYDEPETYISANSQRELICSINKMIRPEWKSDDSENLQFVIATHSPDVIFRNSDVHKKIIKLHKKDKNIQVCQFDEDKWNNLVNERADLTVSTKEVADWWRWLTLYSTPLSLRV